MWVAALLRVNNIKIKIKDTQRIYSKLATFSLKFRANILLV
jgi:hypothetical protein